MKVRDMNTNIKLLEASDYRNALKICNGAEPAL